MDIKKSSICCGCLGSDRKMHIIDEYWRKQCFLQIISEIPMLIPEADPVSLCWECEAQLRSFTKFKQKVKYSYVTLNVVIKQEQKSRKSYIQDKPKLTTHKLLDLSLIPTDNIESYFEVIKPDYHSLDSFDNTFADANSDDEILKINCSKKLLNGKVKKKKSKLCIKANTTSKCVHCNSNIVNNDHICIKTEERNESIEKVRRKKTKLKSTELYEEVDLSKEELEEERRLAMLREEYVNAMFKCEKCILCFANAEDLEDHINIKHELNSSKFKCNVCECSFGTEVSYNYHIKKHTRRYQCVVCSERFGSKRAFVKHYETIHCHGTVTENGSLDVLWEKGKNGENSLHGDNQSPKQEENSYPCEFCTKSFRWKTSLRKHVETHRIETGQKRKPYCEPCRLTFTTTSNLQKHVKTSSKHQIQLKLRKLKDFPPEDMTNQDRIEQIKCSVNRAKQVFPCPQCDKKFQWRGNMLRHVHSHAARAKGELVCEPCNRTFSSIATYKQHLKISKKHVSENDFKYMCSDCGKKFANKTRLKDHINWEHLKNYVHSCSLCQKIFKSHTSLYLHKQVVHRKDNSEHLCHYCGKSFPNQSKLRGHMRASHSRDAPYRCGDCGARFSWHSCLSRHARRAHAHVAT